MNLEIKVLSHACLLIKTDNNSIIIDPWLLGSCYWRSWWNFPKAKFEVEELEKVDAVIISHVHWDHWHGLTLRKFFKEKKIIIPDEPGLRSRNDLNKLGFRTSIVKHSKTLHLGDFRITLYNFGLIFTDAAIVIEAAGKVILNVNDAKIAGLPLRNILKNHGKIDFAFRSHSSANPRICYEIEGGNFGQFDDPEHYLRSFKLFMDAVNPNYAIPFASNHCHLHKDVYRFNSYISDPIKLQKYLSKNTANNSWELKVMMPGSKWSKENSFELKEPKEFINKEHSLNQYLGEVGAKLDSFYEKEMKVDINKDTWAKFIDICKTPFFYRKLGRFMVTVTKPNGSGISKLIDKQDITDIDFSLKSTFGIPLIIIPAIVFRDAVKKNMFEHAGISKRCRYIASNEEDMKRLLQIVNLIERRERLPLNTSIKQLSRFPIAYIRRWREIYVYLQAAYYKYFKRLPLYLIEERILEKT